MNWEPQHLPWKVEPQIDGAPYPEKILAPGVLDAALPESDLGKFSDRTQADMPAIEDEPQADDTWIEAAFENLMPEAAPGAESGIDEAVFEEGPRYLQDDRKVKDDKMASPGGKRPLEFLSHRSPRGGVECSILDRERGYINEPGDLPEELSYPMLCVCTLDDLPHIEEPLLTPYDVDRMLVSYEYTNEELVQVFKIFNERHNKTLPQTAKTIKKLRDNPPPKGFIPYPWQYYEGTPIGKLLKDHPKAGRAALSNLHNYFMMWVFEGDDWCMWPRAPTRAQMIIGFMESPRIRGIIFPKRDLAEKQFDLLVEYGLIKGWKGYTNKKHLLYYATQKSGPHEIRTGPRMNKREYYISNNK